MFFLQCANAQNWFVYVPNSTATFISDTSQLPNDLAWAETVSFNGVDSVYHFNRVVELNLPGTAGVIGKYNQPSVLGDSMIPLASGDQLFFLSTDTFLMKPGADSGISWLVSSMGGLTAQVAYVRADSTFGLPDSVKVIYLNSGDSLAISKNFGVTHFRGFNLLSLMHYSLVAIVTDTTYGEPIIGFHDIFNFDVGDVFQYYGMIHDGSGPCESDKTTQIHILSKSISNDSITYLIRYYSLYQPIYFHFIADSGTVSFIYVDTIGAPWRSIPKSLIPLISAPLNANNNFNCAMNVNPNDSFYSTVQYAFDDTIKSLSIFSDPPILSFALDSTLFNCVENGIANWYSIEMSNRLGIVHHSYQGFEYDNFFDLTAYYKAATNDTVGTLFDTSYFKVGIREISPPSPQLLLSPNPASDKITIAIQGFDLAGEKTFEITDVLGRVFSKNTFSGSSFSIDVASLPSGIYFLTLYNKENSLTEKFLKE